MVLEMISKDFKGLFTGDIGMVTEEKLIQNGCLEDVDFLKTAHHGSRYSTGAEFLEIVRPELAVVSCSATNTYGASVAGYAGTAEEEWEQSADHQRLWGRLQ